jgi:hypothetical protein
LSIRCFSSERLEAARLVKWNVDYLAVSERTNVSTTGLPEWKAKFRNERSGTLLGPEGSRVSASPRAESIFERPAGWQIRESRGFGTARNLRTA